MPIERHYDMGCIEIDMINTHGLDMTKRLYYLSKATDFCVLSLNSAGNAHG